MFVRRHAGGVGWAGRAGLCAALLGVWWLTGAPAQAGCLEEGRCLEREPVPQWPDVARDAAHFTYNCTSGVYAVGCRFWEGSQALVERHVLEDVERDMVERPRVFLCPAGSRPFGPRVQWRSDWATRDAPRLYTGQSPTVMHPVYYGGADGFLLETSRTFALVYNCTGDAQAREFGYELLKRRAAGCPWGSQGRQCERADTLPAPGKNNGACCPLHPARQAPREGESIDPGTGNVYHREADYAGAGAFALRFERHYNSYGWGRDAGMGQRWRHSYSREVFARGLTATVYRADGSSWHFRRLGGGEWAPDADVSARLWALHDEHGAVSGWELALSDDSREGYDAQGRWQWAMQRGGLTQRAHYDGSGRLAWVSDPFGRRLEFEYAGGQLARVFDPAGHRIEYEYDEHGRLRGVEYAHDAPRATRRDYHYEDAAYRYHLSGVSDERGVRSVTWRYDAQGRAVYSARAGGVDALEVSYEADGTATVRDAGGRRTRYGFVVGRAYVLGYAHDERGRVVRIDYPSGAAVHYVRDVLGRVRRVERRRGGVATVLAEGIGYEPFGALNAMRLGNGVSLAREFDRAGRVVHVHSAGVLERDYGYDANDNIVRIDDGLEPASSQHFGYDALERLTGAAGVYGEHAYGYDALGQRTRASTPAGEDVYHYDALSQRLLGVSGANAQAFTYDAAGHTLTRDARSYRYDDAGRLQAVSLAGVERASYRYHASGARALKRTDEGTVRYVYGLDGELLAHTDAHGVLSAEYVYLDGALLARMLPAPPTAPVSGYQLRYEDRRRGPDGTVVVVPRVELELTLRPARLTLHEQGQLRHSEALRVRHPIADDPRLTVFTGTGAGSHTRIVVSRDPDTGAARYSARIRAPAPGGGRFKRNLRAGELIAADAVREPASGNSAVHYYHLDHLGTPQALSDDTGAVVWRADYLPFGEVLETVADTEQPIRFPGQFVDEAVGAYYNYQRWYAPQLGRYLSSDPIGLDGGINTYGYVGGNPLNRTDPTGEAFALLAAPFVGGGLSSGAVGHILGILTAGAVVAYNLPDIVDGLNGRDDGDGISVPIPPKNRGRYTCICRVQADGRSTQNCPIDGRGFAYGYGEGPSLRSAKRAAEKMAKEILGAASTHHPQCRCTDKKGQPVRPHG